MSFFDRLELKWKQGKNVCLGLDEIPDILLCSRDPDSSFDDHEYIYYRDWYLNDLIQATQDIVACYKINPEFWNTNAQTQKSMLYLIKAIRYYSENSLIIFDRKYADVQHTNEHSARYAFDELRVDAVTVDPYTGMDAMAPFYERSEKGVFFMCSTSNDGSGMFQEHGVINTLYRKVAKEVSAKWNIHKNCGMVVGATDTDRMDKIRNIAKDVPFLIPGVGAQGGSLRYAANRGATRDNLGIRYSAGFVVSASRSLLEVEDPDISIDQYIEGVLDKIHDMQREINSAVYHPIC